MSVAKANELVNKGLDYFHAKDYENAEKYYKLALKEDKNNFHANHNLGVLYENVSKPDQSIQHYKEALRINPDYAESYYGLGHIYIEKKNYVEGIKNYKEALRVNPNHPSANYAIALAYYYQKNDTEAIKFYEKAIEQFPGKYNAYYGKAVCLKNLKKHQEAINFYTKSIEYHPTYADAYYSRGLSYEDKGDTDQMLKDFNKALQLDPNHILALCARGKYFTKVGRPQDAMVDFDKAYQLQQEGNLNKNFKKEHYDFINYTMDVSRKDLMELMKTTQNITTKTESQKVLKEKIVESLLGALTIQGAGGNKEIDLIKSQIQELQISVAQINGVLQDSGTFKKADIKKGFEELYETEPKVYEYCKVFYWTLLNYFLAYRTISTGLVQTSAYNKSQTSSSLIQKGVQAAVSLGSHMVQTIPVIGGLIGFLDEVVGELYKEYKDKQVVDKAKILMRIIQKNSHLNLEEDISLALAIASIKIGKAKKNEINNFKPSSQNQFNTGFMNLIEQFKSKISSSSDVYQGPAPTLALADTVLLLSYFFKNENLIIKNQKLLEEQIKDIIVTDRAYEMIPSDRNSLINMNNSQIAGISNNQSLINQGYNSNVYYQPFNQSNFNQNVQSLNKTDQKQAYSFGKKGKIYFNQKDNSCCSGCNVY